MQSNPKSFLLFNLRRVTRIQSECDLRIEQTLFSANDKFALAYLEVKQLEVRPILGVNQQMCFLMSLHSGAIARIDDPDSSNGFTFCRAHDDRLVRTSVTQGRIRIELLRVNDDLSFNYLQPITDAPIHSFGTRKIEIRSFALGFSIDHFPMLGARRPNGFGKQEVFFVDSAKLLLRMENENHVLFNDHRKHQFVCGEASYHNVFRGEFRMANNDHRSIAFFNLLRLNFYKQKTQFWTLKKIQEMAVLISARFSVVKDEPSRLKLVNARTGKLANHARLVTDGSQDLFSVYLDGNLGGKIVKSYLYCTLPGSIHKFDISSGTPEEICRVKQNSLDQFRPSGVSLRVIKMCYLVVKKVPPIEDVVRQNCRFLQKYSSRKVPNLKNFEFKFEFRNCDQSDLGLMDLDAESNTLHLVFSILKIEPAGHPRQPLVLDCDFVHRRNTGDPQTHARRSYTLNSPHFERLRLLLLSVDLGTSAVRYQLTAGRSYLRPVKITPNRLFFAFSHENVQTLYILTKLKCGIKHLKSERTKKSKTYRGMLAMQNHSEPVPRSQNLAPLRFQFPKSK